MSQKRDIGHPIQRSLLDLGHTARLWTEEKDPDHSPSAEYGSL
jgi:hypothetical protein